MDNADRADIEIQRAIDRALAARRAPELEPTLVCVECGGDIEPQRLQLGLSTCFDCANWLEMHQRRTVV